MGAVGEGLIPTIPLIATIWAQIFHTHNPGKSAKSENNCDIQKMFKCEIWIAYPMLWPGFGKKQIQGKGNFSQCIAMPVPKIASFLQSVKKEELSGKMEKKKISYFLQGKWCMEGFPSLGKSKYEICAG